MGGLRLAKAGFTSMPRALAVIAILAGGAAVAFGVALPFIQSSEEGEPPAPRIALEPEASTEGSRVRDEVHAVVGTADGDPMVGVRVSLIPLFSDEGAETRSGRTDEAGRVAFTDLDVTPGTPYVAEARFDGATFPSEVLRFGSTKDDPVRIVVAETTRGADDLTLELESIAIIGDEQGVQAVHAVTVRNRGERAFIGGLRLPLLPGANAIDPRAGLDRRYLELDRGSLISSAPLPPGRRDITYTYVAPMPRSGLRFAHRPSFDTERFEVLVGGEVQTGRAQGLSAAGDVRVGPRGQEREYRRYEARDVDRGDRLLLVISAGGSSPVLRAGGLIVAVLLAFALFAFPLVRRRRRQDPSPNAPEPVAAE
ncbi:MAG: hypothetical protein ACRDKJ_10645 [Actinomycetota bacterium]